MIKEYKGSRFYPCPHSYGGEWCGGTAALVNNKFVCQKCRFAWDQDGQPIVKGDDQ